MAEKFLSESQKLCRSRNLKIAKSEGYIAVVGNSLLGSFKLWAGYTCGSLAVIADAWETLSDCLSSVVLLVGIKVSEKPADAEHPFGHGRAELIASLAIAMMLGSVGFTFSKGGIEKIIAREHVEFGWLALSAMVATIVVKEAMAQYTFWAARKTRISSLNADAYHHRSDTLSSLILLVGMLIAKFGGNAFWWMDGALSCVVGILLLRLAWVVLQNTASKLLGTRVPRETENRIRKICERICKRTDIDLHHMHCHEYGMHMEITFHIRFDGDTPLREVHACADEIEKTIFRELAVEATIHLEIKKATEDA